MLKSAHHIDHRTLLAEEIDALLKNLGTGKVDGVAYDTAWGARLAPHYPGYGFENSLEWLRQNQYEDGTWGAPLVHYHDRFISTLAAIVALRDVGQGPRDERRIKRGEDALWRLVGRLSRDDSDTVGFPILSLALTEEAAALGLDIPRSAARFAGAYMKKVQALLDRSERNWRATSLAFSLEALRSQVHSQDEAFEANNSISVSPSATVGYLLAHHNELALSYLRAAMEDEGTGGIPALAPVDLFEISWSLNHLYLANAVSFDNPEVRRVLDHLWSAWSPDIGVGYSSYLALPEVDDTAACFTALYRAGYPVSPEVFSYYEKEDHFCCFHNETNPSVSIHVRLLLALRHCEDYPQYEAWVQKIISTLHRLDNNGSFWWDKWHASPYYVNSASLSALHGIDNELAQTRLKWIIRTQNDDGGWGYLGQSTPEETAYCLEALLFWDQKAQRIDSHVLAAAANYLFKHLSDKHNVPLWIGKSLYTPRYPVRAAILGALFSYISRE